MDRPPRCAATAQCTMIWGLLRPTPTPREPRQTGQPPLMQGHGPREGG